MAAGVVIDKLHIGDSIAVILIFGLFLVMLGGVAIAMTLREFKHWRRSRWP